VPGGVCQFMPLIGCFKLLCVYDLQIYDLESAYFNAEHSQTGNVLKVGAF